MFGNSNGKNASPLTLGKERFDTLIGRQTEIQGNLQFGESIRIDGKVVGNVGLPGSQEQSVVIGPTGEVQGDVSAGRVIVAGKVLGNIHAFEKVELDAAAVVHGDIKYQSIAMAHGCRVHGLLLHLDASEPTAAARLGTQEVLRRARSGKLDR